MGFKIEEATIEEIQKAFRSNELTSTQLVQYYLDAIKLLNPTLSAVIEVNPDALSLAQEADRNRNLPGGCYCKSMSGIPVLLKDNIATKDKLNTTSGSYALLGSVVPRDAGVIDRLRRSGAIILGKAGLSQWANFRSLHPKSSPNGWSSRGGTVKNPYLIGADPGGSSTGSAVCVAANLVTVSLGTETNGSILNPSSCNGVVGIKPTVGLTSRSGVIPISLRQDTVGPMGRTVSDAVHLLDVIVGYDPRDEITKNSSKYIPKGGYKQFLKANGLNGKRLGNLSHHYTFKSTSQIPDIFQNQINVMSKNGAHIINGLDLPNFETMDNPLKSGELTAWLYEFKRDLNAYLSFLLESPIRTLGEAIAFNKSHADLEKLEEYDQMLFIKSEKTTLPDKIYDEKRSKLAELEEGFEKFMRDNNLDAIVTPISGASLLASGGYPGITVPAGFDIDIDIEDGVPLPFGILFGGLKGSEPKLIEIAYSFEQLTKARKPPPQLPT